MKLPQKTGDGALSGNPLPLNSVLIHFGDSITENGKTESSTNTVTYSRGFAPTANMLAGSRFYVLVGGNLGMGGNTTTNMLARISTALVLKPKVATVLGGANDIIGSAAAATIIANLSRIYQAFLATGCKVIAVTIMPQYGSYLPSAPNEAIRIAVNNWIKSQAGTEILVVDAEGVTNAMLSDGLHPNALGGQYLGGLVAAKLSTLLPKPSIAGLITADASLAANPWMTGTSGTPNTGVTGQVATSWILDADPAGGATVAGSKSTESDGATAQIITVSGTYTGTTSRAVLVQNNTTAGLALNDVVEGILDFEIVSRNSNLLGVYYKVTVYTAAYASTLATLTSLFPFDGTAQFPLGRFTTRTPPIKVVGGTPAIVKSEIVVLFRDTTPSLPVSGVVKIYTAGVRKI